jgi:hypothetical protein
LTDVKVQKKAAVQEKYRFYIQLMKNNEHQKPITGIEVGARLQTGEQFEDERRARVLTNWVRFTRKGAEQCRREDREWREHLEEEVTQRVTTWLEEGQPEHGESRIDLPGERARWWQIMELREQEEKRQQEIKEEREKQARAREEERKPELRIRG